jgi:hypothetical protein
MLTPGQVENKVLEWLKPWAFNAHGYIIYTSRENVGFLKNKLIESGIDYVEVKMKQIGSGLNW